MNIFAPDGKTYTVPEFVNKYIDMEQSQEKYKKALEAIVNLSNSYAYNMHDEFLEIAEEALK